MNWKKAIANKRLRESGKLEERYYQWRIVKVENSVYTLRMGEEEVQIKLDCGVRNE